MRRILSAVAVAMLLAAFVPEASATDSRSQSLLYNLAFEDQTDVFLFPQLLPDYEGAYFHLPAALSNVFGGVILEMGEGAFGVFIHRPLGSAFDQYRIQVTNGGAATGAFSDPGYPVEPHFSGQIFDVIYGARTWGVGLRMFLWSDVSTQFLPLADPGVGTAAFTGELNTGFRVSPGFDLRINAGLRHDADTSNLLIFRIGIRYLEPGDKRMRLVVAAELQGGFMIYPAPPDPPGGPAPDAEFGFTIPIKAGLYYTVIPEKLYLGLLGGMDVQILKIHDPATPGEAGDAKFGLGIPTLELAVEWRALDWMQVRCGIKGGWGIQFAGGPPDPDDPDKTLKPKYEQMTFSSGLGFPLGPFTLDAVVQYSLWQDGPYFIGGAAGLFAGVSISYQWGSGVEARSAGEGSGGDDSWGTPKAAKPKPVIKPKPKPPPAEEKPAEEKPAEEKPKEKKGGSFEGWEEE